MLRDELERKSDGLSASPDPRRTLMNDLLEALKKRYRVEGRRSLERLQDAAEHLLGMFRGLPAAQVKGADVLSTRTFVSRKRPSPPRSTASWRRSGLRIG